MSRARALRRTVDRARDLSARTIGEPVVVGVGRGGALVLAHAGRELGVVPAQHVSDFLERVRQFGARVTRPMTLGADPMERSSSLDELRHVVAAEVGS